MGNREVKTRAFASRQKAYKKGEARPLKGAASPATARKKKASPESKKTPIAPIKKAKALPEKTEKKVNKSKHSSAKKGESKQSRQRAFITAYVANRFSVAAACREIGIGRTIFYRWMKSGKFSQELADAKEERLDIAEASLFRNIQAGDPVSLIFFLKTIGKIRGYVEAERVRTGEIPAKHAMEILDELLAGNIDAVAAALQFTKEGLPLPRALELMLSKVSLPEPTPELPPEISDEELEAAYQRKKAEIDDQKEKWLPKRQAEVATLKEEMKNIESFGPGAAPVRDGKES